MTLVYIFKIFLIIYVDNLLVLARKKEDKYVGFDHSNQTSKYSINQHAKESGEKILKGIWLVLGIFLLVALFLLGRFAFKGISVLCLHQG